MTVVPAETQVVIEDSAVPLARYAQILGINECAFWGVTGSDDYACHKVWTLEERRRLARYLAEAQDEIEQLVGYPLSPRYFASEQHPYLPTVHTRWGKVIETGIKATSAISTGAAVNHATDPAVIGPIATTVTDEGEIRVYYPASLVGSDTEAEINPSRITISGGNVTIQIPRCRMVHPTYIDNPDAGLDYTNTATYFLQTVDVKRVYTDASTQGVLVWPHKDSDGRCSCLCGCDNCSESTETACLYVRNGETGAIDVMQADYASGAWSAKCETCYCSRPELARVSYKAGITVTRQLEECIIKLAHTKMPFAVCSCDITAKAWEADRFIPPVLTSERLNCTLGLSNGAWTVYRWIVSNRLMRASVL